MAEALITEARKIAEKIRRHSQVNVVTHIDADGITAGSIACKALDREGIDYEITFLKQLDPLAIEALKNENKGLIWFTDLGSGQIENLSGLDFIITDHHVPDISTGPHNGRPKPSKEVPGSAAYNRRPTLFDFSDGPNESSQMYHLNPHLFGGNGAEDASGAGMAYLVARELGQENFDLSSLAIVGAVGDLQSVRYGKLVGINRDILEEGMGKRYLKTITDIQFFGRETRPLVKLLQYANEPVLPRLTNDEENCINFLIGLGIELKEEEHWRRWIDLFDHEKRSILSELAVLLIENGLGHKAVRRMVGQVYLLEKEEEGTELHDTKEFATLLNACGRYDRAEVGLRVCMGDRDEWLKKARTLLQGHRRTLVEALHLVKEIGISQRSYLQHFHGTDEILDSIVGVVCGMVLNSGMESVDRRKPIFGFANALDGSGVKVSARGTRVLVDSGLDLSQVMKSASEKVGGAGGGHNVAAGATIPSGTEEKFLEFAEEILSKQLRESSVKAVKLLGLWDCRLRP